MAHARGTRWAVGLLLAAVLGAGTWLTAPLAAQAADPPDIPWQAMPVVLDGQVNAFARLGDLVVVGGTFTSLQLPSGTVVDQPHLFAYDFATGEWDAGFRPVIDGDVLALAADDTGVVVGGTFETVNGLHRAKLVRLSAAGSVDTAFVANADARVQALALSGDELFVGGQFQVIGGKVRTRLAQVSASTGAVSADFRLALTGTAGPGGSAGVQALDVSSDGSRLLVAHTAQRLAGLQRYGVAVVDLGSPATVDPWRTDLFKSALNQTGGVVRVTGASWGADGTWFVVSNSGGDKPPTNDCVQRFDLTTPSPAGPTWVSRMFDSVYSVAVGPDGSVYAGGHFRFVPAPGSIDPYPGDPDVNYGGGLATEGARTLGDQVVMRDKVAALDPVAGKALNWWSSANGQKGVSALLVTQGRVLIGHDGTQVDGHPTGRQGMALAVGAPTDLTSPGSTVSEPLDGANLEVGPLPVAGTAWAPAGVDQVLLEVKRASNQWLQPDGSWGSYYAFTPDLAAPGATSTPWSQDLDLADAGDYVLLVRTRDGGGTVQAQRTTVHVLTNDPTNAPPSTSWVSPRKNQTTFSSNTLTVSGTASDPQGVTQVQLTFFNRDLGGYVSSSGVVGPFASMPARVVDPGATTTAWSLRVTLPDGHYASTAKGTDALGLTDPTGTRREFVLFPGNAPPSLQISRPKPRARVAAFTVTGRAQDDTGVARVMVKVADVRFGRGLTRTGDFGEAAWIPATLAHPRHRSTTWSLKVPRLPVGTYRVTAYAVDSVRVGTPVASRPSRKVRRWPSGVTTQPVTTISSPQATDRFPDLTVTITGKASYRPGVRRVRYALFDAQRGKYLRADGSYTKRPTLFGTTLSAAGAAVTKWSAGVTLPHAGVWRIDAQAVGVDRSVDATPAGSRVRVHVFPGDADPTVELNAPTNGQMVAGTQGIVTVGGRAFDDVGVEAVQVLIRNESGTKGVRADHSLGKRAQWVRAYLTNRGGVFTNFSVVTPPLPSGTWLVSARAVDSVGKATLAYPTHTVTVQQ
jgi:hypothetical protein